MKFLILLFFVLLISCSDNSSEEKNLEQIMVNNQLRKTIIVKTNNKIDLKTCIKEHSYPQNIPQKFYWKIPDTTSWDEGAKIGLNVKYTFDEYGKIKQYFYQGSIISGILPLEYIFTYDVSNPNLISEISDVFYKEKYRIVYNQDNSVELIEKLDSLNNRIEIFKVLNNNVK